MNESNVLISICPFDRTPCRGPECPLLVYQDSDGGSIYYCGLNHYCPEGCYAFPVTPASRARRSPPPDLPRRRWEGVHMSRKFNDVRSGKKALFYGSANGLGPFRPRPKKKKSAASASNTDSGKETQHDH